MNRFVYTFFRMKIAVTVFAFVATAQLVLGAPPSGYGQPQPQHPYRTQNGGGGSPIPAKYPAHHGPGGGGQHFGNKNDFYSKYNPHSLPPGVRGPPPFAKFPSPSPGKHHHHHHHQQQQQQQQQAQQAQQKLYQQKPQHSAPPSFRPLGPQHQSKPHVFLNGAAPQGHAGVGHERIQHQSQSRPVPKITNIWSGPKMSAAPDFSSRFPAVTNAAASFVHAAPVVHAAPAAPSPPPEHPRAPYIINSDDERGPIKTIPAPNLNPADRPAGFDEQLFKIQHQQSYAQQLDNSITDDKLSAYQVTRWSVVRVAM